MAFCSATENDGTISVITLTFYATTARAGHVDQLAVSIPTFPETSVNES